MMSDFPEKTKDFNMGKEGKECLPSGAKQTTGKMRIHTKAQPLVLYLTPQIEAAQRLRSEVMELADFPKA